MRNFYFIFISLLPLALSDSLVKISRKDPIIYLEEGELLQLKCEVTTEVSEDPKLKWYNMNKKEITTTNNNEDAFIVSIHTGQLVLYVKGLKKQAGEWSCKGTIAGVLHEDTRMINIYIGITFDGCEKYQYPKEGKNGFINCKVTGSPPPTITWYKDSKILDTSGKKYRHEIGTGLRINDLKSPNDDGTYTLMAATDRQVRQSVFIIMVSTVPKITQGFNKDMKLAFRKKKTFKCQANSRPDAKYKFYRKKMNSFDPDLDLSDMRPLGSSEDYEVDGDKGFIQFNNPAYEDTGTYLCVATNQAGEDKSFGFIRVHMQPSFVRIIQPTNAREGRKEEFKVTFQAYPFPSVVFQKRHQSNIKYELGEKYENGRIKVEKVDDRTVKLVLNKASWKDYGNYTIRLKNDEGHVAPNETLRIKFQPRLQDTPKEVYAWASAVRNLSCEAISYPPPEINWYRKDRDQNNKLIYRRLTSNETLELYPMEKKIGGRYVRNLQIRVRLEVETWAFFDKFYCGVDNGEGKSVNTSVVLKRAETPGPPRKPRQVEITPTTVTLAVDPPEFDGHVPITGYRVAWLNMHFVFKFPHPKDQKLYIENLIPATTYRFKIRAVNNVGAGEGVELDVETPTSTAPKPIVINGDKVSVEPYSYDVKWRNPQTGGSPIILYYFKYRAVKVDPSIGKVIRDLSGYKEKRVKDNPDRPMTSYTLTHLQENTHYEVTIEAENNIGKSKISNVFLFKTRPAKGYTGSNSNKTTLHSTLILTALLLFVFREIF